MNKLIENQIDEHISLLNQIKDQIISDVILAAEKITKSIENGGKIILFGNGGSASDAQHIAAEFTGRFVKERRGLPALSLATDTSALTAIGNDYGFDQIFQRQIEAIAKPEDILIGISTSGNSRNVLNAIKLGNDIGCFTIGLTGKNGGTIGQISQLNLNINSDVTARIQEIHILVGHLICSIIDKNFN